MLGKAYLVAYNLSQFAGWSYMLWLTTPLLQRALLDESGRGALALWTAVEPALKLFQTAAVLEVLHAALGLVRSSAMVTLMQVFSRVAVTWAVVDAFPAPQSCRGVPLFLLAWEITEVIRYSFYAAGLLKLNFPPLTWLRYTLFLILYPMGVTGELWCGLAALPELRGSAGERFSLRLPNAANWAFDAHSAAVLYLLSYLPLFPQMFLHMVGQRKKVIGGAGQKGKQD